MSEVKCSRRGVSEQNATLITISLALIAGLLTYLIFTGYTPIITAKGQVTIESVELVKSTAGPCVFTCTVKNVGGKSAKSITLNLASEREAAFPGVSAQAPLEPGRSVAIMLSSGSGLMTDYVAGKTYPLTVKATFLDGSTFTNTLTVTCIGGGRRLLSNDVLKDYYDDVMTYAPHWGYDPITRKPTEVGAVRGRWISSAAFSVEFLYEAYFDPIFKAEKSKIYSKVVQLSDFMLSLQCRDDSKRAYGGFNPNDQAPAYYYSIDAERAIPALLKTYDLTGNASYLEAAKIAAVFLYTMQHRPYEDGVVRQYYGGFAELILYGDTWASLNMRVLDLYGSRALKMLYDQTGNATYQTMIEDLVGFLRPGFENYYLWYVPSTNFSEPDPGWGRIGNCILDDDYGDALWGLYYYEGWSLTVEKVYTFLNSIDDDTEAEPNYDHAVCWPGYMDVVNKQPGCGYYDSRTAFLISGIRHDHDKPSLRRSIEAIVNHPEVFKYWGVGFDFTPVEGETNMPCIVNIAQLAHLLLRYALSYGL